MKKENLADDPPYMTAVELARICRFRSSEPIRRAVARGELPGHLIQKNRLLIPTEAFWKWFHRNDIKPKTVKEAKIPAIMPIEKPEAAA